MSQYSAFFLTLLLESGVSVIWLCMPWAKKIKVRQLLLATLCVSCLTHPFAWWINELLKGQVDLWTRILLVEGMVIITEGGLYTYLVPISISHGLTLSLISNCFSFGVGVALLQGW